MPSQVESICSLPSGLLAPPGWDDLRDVLVDRRPRVVQRRRLQDDPGRPNWGGTDCFKIVFWRQDIICVFFVFVCLHLESVFQYRVRAEMFAVLLWGFLEFRGYFVVTFIWVFGYLLLCAGNIWKKLGSENKTWECWQNLKIKQCPQPAVTVVPQIRPSDTNGCHQEPSSDHLQEWGEKVIVKLLKIGLSRTAVF